MTEDNAPPDRAAMDTMLRLVCGTWISRAIHVAIILEIPDLLRNGPASSTALAASCGADAPSLHRLLRALTAEGVFAMDGKGRFELTPAGATLRSDTPRSLRDWALLMLGDVHGAAWGELLTAVQTGGSAFQARYGQDLWAYSREHPEHGALFDRGMAGFTETYVASVLAAFSFTEFRTIVDVGGGDGSLLVGILIAHRAARGVVFEVASVTERAVRRVEDAGLSGRCVVVTGDAFAAVPAGGDAYVLSRVLHDWDDTAATRLLANCRAVLNADGRVLVLERIVPARPEDFLATPRPILSDTTLTDLNMMVMTTGRERTLSEYESLFAAAGLELIRTVSTGMAMQLMELRRTGSDLPPH